MSVYTILGDVHLGKGVGIGRPASSGNLNSRIQDQLNLLNWTLNTALAHDSKHIIITGDVYEEPRPHPALIQFFMTWLKACERNGVAVDIITGNHDIVRTGSYTVSALDIIPAVELSHATTHKEINTVEYSDVTITFLPYRDRRMYDLDTPAQALELLQKELKLVIPKTHKTKLLIGHLSLEGSIPIGDEIDDMLNEIFCPVSMFTDFNYVWMGHIHKPQIVSTNPYVAHIGSMDRSDFHVSETSGNKILILFDSSKINPITELVIPTRPLYKLEIDVPTDKDTTDFLINYLYRLNKEKPFTDSILNIDIQLNGDVKNVDRDKLTKFIYNNLKVHHICHFSESRNISIICADSDILIDNNIGKSAAIKTYADNLKLDDTKKNRFIAVAMECVSEFQEKTTSE